MILKSVKPKIAIGGIEHETAGFLKGNTSLSEFKERSIHRLLSGIIFIFLEY